MRGKVYYIGMSLILMILCGCQDQDKTESFSGSVAADLTFSVSHTSKETRLTDAVVQEQGSEHSYRGLDVVAMIPFTIGSRTQIVSSDRPLRLFDEATQSIYPKTSGNYGAFYLYKSYTIMRGTNAFLVYGKGKPLTGGPMDVASREYKAFYGSLQVSEPNLSYPDLATLRFRPDPIYKETGTPQEAQLLADYLTDIAEATQNGVSWNNATDPTLKGFFLNFTGQENNSRMVMAGSTVNVIAHVNALYSNIVKLASDADGLRNAIIARITNPLDIGINVTSTGEGEGWKLTEIKKLVNGNSVNFDYPASVGLPDGAAALQWAVKEGKYQFVPQTETTTVTNINNIKRFCYPAELFYYVNSRIDTSNKESDMAAYYSASDWSDVISQYENKNALVTGNTQAVAIREPLQYAVGRLKMSMQASAELKDGANKSVTWTNTSFPLTGIIVCNQHPVGFDFKPLLDGGVASHAEDCFMYDNQVGTNYLSTTSTDIPSTLVLQSYDTGEGENRTDAEEVTILLEFRNDSGQKFKGNGGVIYAGSKFYLIGKIKPQTKSNPEDYEKRVFTQDYVTTVSTKVESLANAYNVLPDLLGGRLELGVELTTNWIQAETTNVILQ